jgi:hypothetical protein
MRLWTRNSIGYKVCEYPPRLYHYSLCYDIDDWTVLSICVASLRLFPYHHTYILRPLLSVLRYQRPDCIIHLRCFSAIVSLPIMTLRLPPRILHLPQSLRSFAVTKFHNFPMSIGEFKVRFRSRFGRDLDVDLDLDLEP